MLEQDKMYTLIFFFMLNLVPQQIIIQNIQTEANCHSFAQITQAMVEKDAMASNLSLMTQYNCIQQ